MLTYNGMQEGFSEWIATMRKTVKASLYIEVSTYISKFGEVVILLGLNDTDILAVCVVFNPSQRWRMKRLRHQLIILK